MLARMKMFVHLRQDLERVRLVRPVHFLHFIIHDVAVLYLHTQTDLCRLSLFMCLQVNFTCVDLFTQCSLKEQTTVMF